AHNELSSLDQNFVASWHGGTVGVESVIRVPALTPNSFFDEHLSGSEVFLFLSIDIEGMDLRVARAIDFEKWRPFFMQMEPSDHYHIQERDAMVAHMNRKGYILIAETEVNLIFVDWCKLNH